MTKQQRGDRPHSSARTNASVRKPGERLRFVVDRVESQVVVLTDADGGGKTFEIDSSLLPTNCVDEGAVFEVSVGQDAMPLWNAAVRDYQEEQQRRADAQRRLDSLRSGDGGGDLAL
jgi:hypothetical protein